MPIPLFYQHSSATILHLLSLPMINEELYPYIFPENIYLIPSKGTQKVVAAEISSPPVQASPPPTVHTTPQIQAPTSAPASQKAKIKTIHAGNSSVLSVVFWGANLQFSASDQELLNKILQACKLNPSDIGLFHADNSTGLLFTDEIAASKAIVFCSPEAIESAKQAQIKLYSNHTLSGKTLLLSDPLSALAQDNVLKGNLWKSLQVLLGI